ncbi:MAG: tol-pal system protein YbgF [Rhizobiaceae bacterium]
MHLRSTVGGALALLMISAPVALAKDGSLLGDMLPGVFGSRSAERAPARAEGVVVAQAGDPRITQLEEQIRQLSGTIEELNFQVLQMQEQMRKMQEDNEFRFQQLEGGGGAQKKSDAGTVAPAEGQDAAAAPGDAATTPKAPRVGEEIPAGDGMPMEADGGMPMETDGPAVSTAPGEPPRTFGTITFDENGNVRDASADPNAAGKDHTVVAALPPTDDPEELYRNSYQFILSGDYDTAEVGFREHVTRFPADGRTADAHFWLGESLLGQQKYREAAEIFLAANRDYPTSKKAPDMLLKLGVSLAGLKQRDVACATFAEVGKRYPGISGALKDRVKQEQALAAC